MVEDMRQTPSYHLPGVDGGCTLRRPAPSVTSPHPKVMASLDLPQIVLFWAHSSVLVSGDTSLSDLATLSWISFLFSVLSLQCSYLKISPMTMTFAASLPCFCSTSFSFSHPPTSAKVHSFLPETKPGLLITTITNSQAQELNILLSWNHISLQIV